jgi:gamma-glutamyltranspeptidase
MAERERGGEMAPLSTGRISWYSVDNDDKDETGRRESVSDSSSTNSNEELMHGHYLPYWKRVIRPSNLRTKRAACSAVLGVGMLGLFVSWFSNGFNDTLSKKLMNSAIGKQDLEDYLIEQSSIDNIYSGAVATDHPICSQIGLSILQNYQGNAVDSAIATALCLGVANPSSSGLGGGHFMMVHMNNVTEFIDSRETAPLASFTHMYENDSAEASLIGGRAIAVWGELRGLQLAHERYGTVPWDILVKPSISLAEDGVVVNRYLAHSIEFASEFLLEQPSSRNLKDLLLTKTSAMKGGRESFLKEGDVLKQPVLANTLKLVAKHGSKVLYEGPLAEAMIKELREEYGSIITNNDLLQYKPKIREPLVVSHNIMGGDFTFVGAPPPSSGGGAVLGVLRMLSGFYQTMNLVVQRNTLSQHLLVEAMKHAFAIRMSLSDPDFTSDSTGRNNSEINRAMEAIYDLVSSGYMDFLRKNYTRFHQVLPLHFYGGPKWSLLSSHEESSNLTYVSSNSHENPNRHQRRMRLFNYLEDHGTTHFSIVDKDRNAVSFSSTINTEFGSGIWLKSSGIVLNNEMDGKNII